MQNNASHEENHVARHENMGKPRSLMWIAVAYVLCIGAGWAWLRYGTYFDVGAGESAELKRVVLHSFIADLIATCIIFAFSRAFKNSSFYDAYWSVVPPLFMVYWWCAHGERAVELRYILISIVVWYWAVRLTWNWIKHWPGLVHEDWRYPMLRNKFPESARGVMDFLMIHFFPTVQVFLGMLPIYAAVSWGDDPIGWLDYVALAVGITAVTIELVADIQLHAFLKNRKPGQIIQHGLWGWSRHPNYFGEFLFWVSLALFGIAAHPEGWWWQILGALAMLGMFMGASIPMMEERSLQRRPAYQQVIDRVSMFFPWPPKS